MKIEIFQGKDKQWYWRCKSRNGQTWCVSEGYVSKSNAKKARMNFYAAIRAGAMLDWSETTGRKGVTCKRKVKGSKK